MKKIKYIVLVSLFLFLIIGISFRMELRGYSEVDRIGIYVLYEKDIPSCDKVLHVTDANIWVNYNYSCSEEDMYILRVGFFEIDLIKALEKNLIDIEDLEDVIECSFFYPG